MIAAAWVIAAALVAASGEELAGGAATVPSASAEAEASPSVSSAPSTGDRLLLVVLLDAGFDSNPAPLATLPLESHRPTDRHGVVGGSGALFRFTPLGKQGPFAEGMALYRREDRLQYAFAADYLWALQAGGGWSLTAGDATLSLGYVFQWIHFDEQAFSGTHRVEAKAHWKQDTVELRWDVSGRAERPIPRELAELAATGVASRLAVRWKSPLTWTFGIDYGADAALAVAGAPFQTEHGPSVMVDVPAFEKLVFGLAAGALFRTARAVTEQTRTRRDGVLTVRARAEAQLSSELSVELSVQGWSTNSSHADFRHERVAASLGFTWFTLPL